MSTDVKPIPGASSLSQKVRDALWKFAELVDEEHGALNGKTALYWSLLYSTEKQIGRKTKKSDQREK